ncbi:GTP-sensing transcriptional pleiotropic repressor CodY [Oxobacter pfennigii]|uniref:Global transcriptional regulator CodY n=1 Tax=Oxobacter pfennigii TaxID=36849 RepID=A0A0P8YAE0_9CLOT|nr:GTP-sensing pleiotropic transcriptional regulator CodY [Oxobacter pfennigii]KPU43919.1 GTP-sensing transcriptional pleiotropic repressor CodY [Oxobacter pfennigii]
MTTLLEKTRMLNRVLQKSGAEPVSFDEICNLLSKVLICNVYLVGKQGDVLGYNFSEGFECEIVQEKVIKEMKFPESYNDTLLDIEETMANVVAHDVCVLADGFKCTKKNKHSTVVPINGNRERLGTMVIARYNKEFEEDDLVLAEYASTIVGMEIIKSKNDDMIEQERKKAIVQLAIGTLSYSELEAVEHIFEELEGKEGLLVASKIADKVGITRSVIVNALRKFESAGVIESRSLGMKGTHIKILNEKLVEELKKIK